MIFNYSEVWIHFDKGTTVILPKDQQIHTNSNLPVEITLIPCQWTTSCWLTESISNAIVGYISQSQITKGITLLTDQIKSLCEFHTTSCSPPLVGETLFYLLNRLLKKLRYLTFHSPKENLSSIHFERYGISS